MQLALVDPISKLVENVRVPFEQATAMPPDVYTSEVLLQAEPPFMVAQ